MIASAEWILGSWVRRCGIRFSNIQDEAADDSRDSNAEVVFRPRAAAKEIASAVMAMLKVVSIPHSKNILETGKSFLADAFLTGFQPGPGEPFSRLYRRLVHLFSSQYRLNR